MEKTNIERLIETAQENAEQFREGFPSWIAANYPIYLEFERQALIVRKQGRKHYSARTIAEYIRHHTMLAEAGGDFKLNDHAIPDMARLFAIRRPEAADLFEYRAGKNGRPVPHAREYANMAEGAMA